MTTVAERERQLKDMAADISAAWHCPTCRVEGEAAIVELLEKFGAACANEALEKLPLEYKHDANNGAGLWAVFLCGTPIHHFREGTDATAYMERIRKAVRALKAEG